MSRAYNEDVAAALAAAGLGLTLGTNLFDEGPAQVQTGVPSEAVFCQSYGDYGTPIRYLQDNYATIGAGIQAKEPRVIVTIRSNPQDIHGGRALARSVRDALHNVPMSGYDAVRIQETDPLHLYQTNNSEHVFQLNCHLWLDE